MADERITLVVADDHTLFREGLIALLSSAEDMEVLAGAATGSEAVAEVESHRPDVVLMDITMPVMSGIEATRALRERYPATSVVMLTMLEDDDSLFAAMCAGAHGYLLKGADPDDVVRTVRSVAGGDAFFGAATAQRLTSFFQQARGQGMSVSPFPELTERELEVLDLLASGADNRRIASVLYISAKTVANHVSNVLTKIHAVDRAQAIVAAREAGLGRGNV